MLISRSEFEKFQPSNTLNTGMVLHRLHKHYCKPMTTRGKCTRDCANCKSHINIIFARLDGEPKDPYAVLVWSIRSEIATIDEATEGQAAPQTNWLGERVVLNPFLEVLKEL